MWYSLTGYFNEFNNGVVLSNELLLTFWYSDLMVIRWHDITIPTLHKEDGIHILAAGRPVGEVENSMLEQINKNLNQSHFRSLCGLFDGYGPPKNCPRSVLLDFGVLFRTEFTDWSTTRLISWRISHCYLNSNLLLHSVINIILLLFA